MTEGMHGASSSSGGAGAGRREEEAAAAVGKEEARRTVPGMRKVALEREGREGGEGDNGGGERRRGGRNGEEKEGTAAAAVAPSVVRFRHRESTAAAARDGGKQAGGEKGYICVFDGLLGNDVDSTHPLQQLPCWRTTCTWGTCALVLLFLVVATVVGTSYRWYVVNTHALLPGSESERKFPAFAMTPLDDSVGVHGEEGGDQHSIAKLAAGAGKGGKGGGTGHPRFDGGGEQTFTVRVNTFRRNDLLYRFVGHFVTCSCVESIQVVWSDQENEPPPLSFFDVANEQHLKKVVFERHKHDSLNNRFAVLEPVRTAAVLSIDDDLLVPCSTLQFGFRVWQSNPRALVGFSPRITSTDPVQSTHIYHGWKHTWWNGLYNIMLTKATFMHKHYLGSYFKLVPQDLLDFIEKNRNCEDIAMAFTVHSVTKGHAPPVWIRAMVHEIGLEGISSGNTHFDHRSHCVDLLVGVFGEELVVGMQKALPLDMHDWWHLYMHDNRL